MKHSGLQGGLLKTNSDHKELFDCICRGEIQLNHDQLWHTVDQRMNMYMNINHQAQAHSVNI